MAFPRVTQPARCFAQANGEFTTVRSLCVSTDEKRSQWARSNSAFPRMPVRGLLISWRKIVAISPGSSAHGGPSTEFDIAAHRNLLRSNRLPTARSLLHVPRIRVRRQQPIWQPRLASLAGPAKSPMPWRQAGGVVRQATHLAATRDPPDHSRRGPRHQQAQLQQARRGGRWAVGHQALHLVG